MPHCQSAFVVTCQYIGGSRSVKMCLCEIIECVFTIFLLSVFLVVAILSVVLKTALVLLMLPLAVAIFCAAAACTCLCGGSSQIIIV